MIAMKRTKEHGPHTCSDCSQGNYSQGIAAIEKICKLSIKELSKYTILEIIPDVTLLDISM